jgi:hypothetical protein
MASVAAHLTRRHAMSAVRKDLRHAPAKRRCRSSMRGTSAYRHRSGRDNVFQYQWVGDGRRRRCGSFRDRAGPRERSRLEPIDPLIAETTERWRPERMAVSIG